jgi:hypothetical protein
MNRLTPVAVTAVIAMVMHGYACDRVVDLTPGPPPDSRGFPADAFVQLDAFVEDATPPPDAFVEDATPPPDAFVQDSLSIPDALDPDALSIPDALVSTDAASLPDG